MLLAVQAELFSRFHDGTFTKFLRCNLDVDIIIDIQYMAEKINEKFTSFRVKFQNCSKFEFTAWGKDHEGIDDLKILGTLELEIISEKVVDDKIVVVCYSSDGNCGGDLVFIADDIMIFDESGQEISFDKLNDL